MLSWISYNWNQKHQKVCIHTIASSRRMNPTSFNLSARGSRTWSLYLIHRQTDRQTDRRRQTHADRQTDRQTGRQADRHRKHVTPVSKCMHRHGSCELTLAADHSIQVLLCKTTLLLHQATDALSVTIIAMPNDSKAIHYSRKILVMLNLVHRVIIVIIVVVVIVIFIVLCHCVSHVAVPRHCCSICQYSISVKTRIWFTVRV